MLSLPSRGAWIEMLYVGADRKTGESRSPHGERGLKFRRLEALHETAECRSPHGERGLKYCSTSESKRGHRVAPLTGSVD